MNELEAAAWEAHELFTNMDVPYAIIGGMAVQYWGEPRFTQDIDLTVVAPLDELTVFVQHILNHFSPRIENTIDFARHNRMVLVKASNGFPLDIALGLPGYEDEVMQRTIENEIAPGKSIRLCSAEDLIIHKAVASRAQDIRDIESIVFRQGEVLDEEYIRKWLAEFVEVTGKSEISSYFEKPWHKIQDR